MGPGVLTPFRCAIFPLSCSRSEIERARIGASERLFTPIEALATISSRGRRRVLTSDRAVGELGPKHLAAKMLKKRKNKRRLLQLLLRLLCLFAAMVLFNLLQPATKQDFLPRHDCFAEIHGNEFE